MINTKHIKTAFINWFDSDYGQSSDQITNELQTKKIAWVRAIPFILLHLACLFCFWVGVSYTAVFMAAFLYGLRMFAITGLYHRYFSHKTFKTNRYWQFIFAFLGATATQRGALWWASHHRHHHRYSDEAEDLHSPIQHGFWWSHMGWFLSPSHFNLQRDKIKDLIKYPELRFLNRFDILPPIMLAIGLFYLGKYLSIHYPSLHTSAWQLVIWGYFISTVAVFHATCCINSIAHRFGKRDYPTRDESRNNFWLALITLGEGWHNNHHYSPGSVRQGFKWWQIDITYYILFALSKLGIIYDLRPLPEHLK